MDSNIEKIKLKTMILKIAELEKNNAKTKKFPDEKMKEKIIDIIMSEADKNDN